MVNDITTTITSNRKLTRTRKMRAMLIFFVTLLLSSKIYDFAYPYLTRIKQQSFLSTTMLDPESAWAFSKSYPLKALAPWQIEFIPGIGTKLSNELANKSDDIVIRQDEDGDGLKLAHGIAAKKSKMFCRYFFDSGCNDD